MGMRELFREVSISIAEGDRLGLIGPNGAGKSTLLKILAKQISPDDGELMMAKGTRIVYIPQQDVFEAPASKGSHGEDTTDATFSAREVVIDAARRGEGSDGHALDEHEAEVLAEQILDRMGFDAAHLRAEPAKLSGGWKKRLSIARGLASVGGEPDVLLLDEPTNHLDLEGITWLEDYLRGQFGRSGGRVGGACVFVTHDRAFLEKVATGIVELSRAYEAGTLAAEGNYTNFLRRKQDVLSAQEKQAQALSNQVRKDLEWLSRKPEARRTKSKSKIEASHDRMESLENLRERNRAGATGGAKVDFNASGRKTRKMLEGTGLAKSLGGRLLFKDVDVAVGAGDCLGLLGPNGSGKTTLIGVLTREVKPDAGEVDCCDPPPRIVVFSQHRKGFDSTMLLREALCPVSDLVRFRGSSMHITAWSRRFLFRDEQLLQPVGSLSGGELARVHIARIMLEPADVLILDEPTNDLDIPTLEVLEEALEDFPGALILVTHDRAMLGRLATEVLALDGLGNGDAKTYADLDQAIRGLSLANAAAAEKEREERRKAEREAATASKAAEGASVAGESGGGGNAAQSSTRKKLSYMEQREYDGLEAAIQKAEAAFASAETTLDDPAVTADHARMAKACKSLENAQAEVTRLYARWEELEAKMA